MLMNYNFEWMNIFCFCDCNESTDENNDKCNTNPRKCIENNEIKFCISLDEWCLEKFPECCGPKKEENIERNAREDCCYSCCCNCDECWECTNYYDE